MANQELKVKLPPVDHIGVVVKDVDKAVEFYESTLGWGPWRIIEAPMEGFTYKGKTGDALLKLAFANLGDIEIELIQVLKGETPHTEHLREKGEGLQHLRCCVDDVDAMLAELAKEGIEPVFSKKMEGMGTLFAYVDTNRVGGIMIELINSQIKAAM